MKINILSPVSAAGHHCPEMPQVRQEYPGHGKRRPLLPHQLRVPHTAEHPVTAAGHPGGAERHGVLPGGDGERLVLQDLVQFQDL